VGACDGASLDAHRCSHQLASSADLPPPRSPVTNNVCGVSGVSTLSTNLSSASKSALFSIQIRVLGLRDDDDHSNQTNQTKQAKPVDTKSILSIQFICQRIFFLL
jgi:hypothetical protein